MDNLSSTARRPHKSPAHTVKDLNHLRFVSDFAPEHFVPSEPLILHRFPYPSTPSAKSFCFRPFRRNPVRKSFSSGQERNNSPAFRICEGGRTNFFSAR